MGKWRGLPHEPIHLCGAKAKHNGQPCKQFAMKNGRCYYHGGRSTGPKSPAVKHGQYTKEAIEFRKRSIELVRASKEQIKRLAR